MWRFDDGDPDTTKVALGGERCTACTRDVACSLAKSWGTRGSFSFDRESNRDVIPNRRCPLLRLGISSYARSASTPRLYCLIPRQGNLAGRTSFSLYVQLRSFTMPPFHSPSYTRPFSIPNHNLDLLLYRTYPAAIPPLQSSDITNTLILPTTILSRSSAAGLPPDPGSLISHLSHSVGLVVLFSKMSVQSMRWCHCPACETLAGHVSGGLRRHGGQSLGQSRSARVSARHADDC
jgi:hypothetical protein